MTKVLAQDLQPGMVIRWGTTTKVVWTYSEHIPGAEKTIKVNLDGHVTLMQNNEEFDFIAVDFGEPDLSVLIDD